MPVDLLQVSIAVGAAIGSFLLTKLLYIEPAIEKLEEKVESKTKEIYNDYVAYINKRRPNPQKSLDKASRYFGIVKLKEQVTFFCKVNRRLIVWDIASLISVILFGIFSDPTTWQFFLALVFAAPLTMVSFTTFIPMLRQVWKFKDRVKEFQS